MSKIADEALKELDNVVTAAESAFPPHVELLRLTDRKPYLLHGDDVYVFVRARAGIQVFTKFQEQDFKDTQTRGKLIRDCVLTAALMAAKQALQIIAEENKALEENNGVVLDSSKEPPEIKALTKPQQRMTHLKVKDRKDIKLEDMKLANDLIN